MPFDPPLFRAAFPNTFANQSPRFCPSYPYFDGFDDAKDGVCALGEEEGEDASEPLQ